MHECITADQELALGKDFWNKSKKITVDAEGLWRQEKEVQLPELTFPDALHVRAALNRRSMAAHCAGICQYEEFEQITSWLMTHKLREVLPCWAPPTWGDFLAADKLEIARSCKGGIAPQYWGYPVAWAIPKVLDLHCTCSACTWLQNRSCT